MDEKGKNEVKEIKAKHLKRNSFIKSKNVNEPFLESVRDILWRPTQKPRERKNVNVEKSTSVGFIFWPTYGSTTTHDGNLELGKFSSNKISRKSYDLILVNQDAGKREIDISYFLILSDSP